jgi:L-alanine-DL-glutamate epimerase-like enolase superfamily enzyme
VPATAERLAAALADLSVTIDGVACRSAMVAVPSYGGPRPTSVVTLDGAGHDGHGEHVGWSEREHEQFRSALQRTDVRGTWRVDTLAHTLRERELPPYDRATVEMAAIDLALQQHRTTLASLAGVTARPVSVVVSFGRVADPVAEAARHRGHRLKIDVDPAWTDDVWAALAATDRVVIYDWKGDGDAAAYARALRWAPAALHEDPGPPYPAGIASRRSLDACITTPSSLDGQHLAACNVKPSRMGSLLAAVRTAARCADRDIPVYVGGMFEIDVGRRQLHDLAAVLCPEAPNDLAPIPLAESTATP